MCTYAVVSGDLKIYMHGLDVRAHLIFSGETRKMMMTVLEAVMSHCRFAFYSFTLRKLFLLSSTWLRLNSISK